jgi:hypothetical protein
MGERKAAAGKTLGPCEALQSTGLKVKILKVCLVVLAGQ